MAHQTLEIEAWTNLIAKVAASSIDAYVLGEHGDSQFVSSIAYIYVWSQHSYHTQVAWSIATIGGVPIDKALPKSEFSTEDKERLSETTKRKAATIIESKGATSFGIGSTVSSICSSILFDKHNVRPISHYLEDLDCCLSLPVVLGRKGVVRTFQLPLNDEENAALKESARSLKEVMRKAKEENK
jgi:L-lactate dehydrogenase